MWIRFEGYYCTDGDFSFRKERMNFDPNSSLYEGAKVEYYYDECCETIDIYMKAKGDSLSCRLALRDILEKLICAASTIKPRLVKDLYELHNYFLDAFYNHKDLNGEIRLSGNYDGTYVRVTVEEDE